MAPRSPSRRNRSPRRRTAGRSPPRRLPGGPLRDGVDLPLACRVRNVGDAPVPPDAVLRADFTLDGDLPIALAHVPLPPIAPGEAFVARANVPMGMPYESRVAWRAEAGRHQIFVRVGVGNAPEPRPPRRAVFAREFEIGRIPGPTARLHEPTP